MSLWTGVSPERVGKVSSLPIYLWRGVNPKWTGKVSSLKMSSQESLWMRKNVLAVSVERSCPSGRVGLCSPRQRKENVCVDDIAGVGCDQNTCLFVWVSSLGVNMNVLHLSIPLFRETLRRHL